MNRWSPSSRELGYVFSIATVYHNFAVQMPVADVTGFWLGGRKAFPGPTCKTPSKDTLGWHRMSRIKTAASESAGHGARPFGTIAATMHHKAPKASNVCRDLQNGSLKLKQDQEWGRHIANRTQSSQDIQGFAPPSALLSAIAYNFWGDTENNTWDNCYKGSFYLAVSFLIHKPPELECPSLQKKNETTVDWGCALHTYYCSVTALSYKLQDTGPNPRRFATQRTAFSAPLKAPSLQALLQALSSRGYPEQTRLEHNVSSQFAWRIQTAVLVENGWEHNLSFVSETTKGSVARHQEDKQGHDLFGSFPSIQVIQGMSKIPEHFS